MQAAFALLIAVTTTSLFGTAQEPRGCCKRNPTDLLITRLGDADEARAEAAARDLIRGGPAVAAPLRDALEKNDDKTFVTRAERVLAMCVVEGPVVDGLRVGLTVDGDVLEPGKKLTLTTTVCNLTDEEVVIWTGMSYAGNVFETGASVRRIVEDDCEVTEQQAACGTGFCGTGAYPLTVTIPAWGFRQFEIPAVYYTGAEGEEQKPFPMGGVGAHLRLGNFMYLQVEEEGSFRLRLSHQAKLLEKGATWWKEPEEGRPNWTGMLESNAVSIELRSPTASGPR